MYWPLMFRTNHERRMFELRAEWKQLLQSEKSEAELREFQLEKRLAEANAKNMARHFEALSSDSIHNMLKRWSDMGLAGMIVSICFGPSPVPHSSGGYRMELCYSVAIMGPNGETLTQNPVRALTLEQAIATAWDIFTQWRDQPRSGNEV